MMLTHRKWILWSLWSAIAAALVAITVLLIPGLVARQNIAQLLPADRPAADRAFRRLHRMGKWAIPALLDGADQRDPLLSELRQGRVPAAVSGSKLSVAQVWNELRDSSDIERRADLCTALLFTHWNSAILSEPQQRRLLRHVHRATIEIEQRVYSIDGPPMTINVSHTVEYFPIGPEGQVSVWSLATLVASTDGSAIRPVPQIGTGNMVSFGDNVVAWLRNPAISPTRSISSAKSGSISNRVLHPNALGIGKHMLYLRVSVGLSADASPDRDNPTPPPWYEELTFGPAEVEVVATQRPESNPTARSEGTPGDP